MDTSRQNRITINPKREHTYAEVHLVMDLYSCDEDKAKAVLHANPTPSVRAEIQGMVDAALVDQSISAGKLIQVPIWLSK